MISLGTAGVDQKEYRGQRPPMVLSEPKRQLPYRSVIPERSPQDYPDAVNRDDGETLSIFTRPVKPGTPQEQEGSHLTIRASERKEPSRAFARVVLEKNAKKMLTLLQELKGNLDRPEGATLMVQFRGILANCWELRNAFPETTVFMLTTLEDAIRGKKWRQFTIGQIDTLEHVVGQLETIPSKHSELSKVFRMIRKSDIDTYPSAEIDEADDDDE